jgi:KaiC/GvpD/RAD55 family RecA-like ATPase
MEDLLKAPSGIERFDSDTGGFISGKTYLISGGAHTAKTVLTAQFLMRGLLSEENALLLTDNAPADFLSLCRDISISMDGYLNTGRLIILKYLFQSENIIRGEKDLSIMLGELENFILANKVARAAIDTAVPLFQMFHAGWFEKGFKILVGVTLLLTSRMPGSQKAFEIKNHAEAIVSGSIHLDELTKSGGHTVRKMTVRKMTHIQPPYPVYEFEIKKGEGIRITSKSSAGLESPREKIRSKSGSLGLSFSKEYKDDSSPAESPPAKSPRETSGTGKKGASFSDSYGIEDNQK